MPTRFIFKGYPGTGMMTTAKHMGQFFHNTVFLGTAKVVQCSSADLVGKYGGEGGARCRRPGRFFSML